MEDGTSRKLSFTPQSLVRYFRSFRRQCSQAQLRPPEAPCAYRALAGSRQQGGAALAAADDLRPCYAMAVVTHAHSIISSVNIYQDLNFVTHISRMTEAGK
eukprot:6190686-Pleurochrysis_carterae.AAC.2